MSQGRYLESQHILLDVGAEYLPPGDHLHNGRQVCYNETS